ncbi:type II toxin-antitoxin system HicB family antitoxin [Candidatus Kuenenbacteria bacterium]|nr:type II toxin-antitoxin system HicB family antitoxin [Candidatus Kuenenbacteria bacterium]
MKQLNKNINFTVVYEKVSEGGYVAYVPTLQGCHTQGETLEETEKNIKEAIELYLECLLEEKKEVFLPKHEFMSIVNIKIPVRVNC